MLFDNTDVFCLFVWFLRGQDGSPRSVHRNLVPFYLRGNNLLLLLEKFTSFVTQTSPFVSYEEKPRRTYRTYRLRIWCEDNEIPQVVDESEK